MKILTMTGCPYDIDERTELYCLNRLSPSEAKQFEAHLAVCPACLSEALETDLFLESLITALEEMEQEQDTELGFIRNRMVRLPGDSGRRSVELKRVRVTLKGK